MIELSETKASKRNATYNVKSYDSTLVMSSHNYQPTNTQQYEVMDYSQYSEPIELKKTTVDEATIRAEAALYIKEYKLSKEKEKLIEWYREHVADEKQFLEIEAALNGVDEGIKQHQFDEVSAFLQQHQAYQQQYDKVYELLNDPKRDSTESVLIIYGQLNQYSEYLSDETKQKMQQYVEEYQRIISTLDADAASTFYDKVIDFRKSYVKELQDAMEKDYRKNKPKQEEYTFGDALLDTVKAYGASAANMGLSTVKGVAKFGEAVGDFGQIATTGVASVFTGAYDLVRGDTSFSTTSAMWEGTKASVARDITSELGEVFNEETGTRDFLDKYAFSWGKSDGAGCVIAEGAGYITGIILLNTVTFGGATAATAATGSSGISSALGAGIWAGIGGTGKNTETAWKNGASIGEGLAYGAAKGAVEGFEMWLGYKINASQIFKGTGFKSAVGNALTHVAMDAADGGLGAIVDPALQLIYMTDEQKNAALYRLNYDKDGNKINDITWDDLNAWNKYTANFNANGGWKNVGTQAASAAVVSFASEVPGVVKVGRASYLVDKISKEGLTEQTLDTLKNLKGKTLESFAEQAGTRMSLENLKDVIPNIEKDAMVKVFDSVLEADDIDKSLRTLKILDDDSFKYLMDNTNALTSTSKNTEFIKKISDIYQNGANVAAEGGLYNEFFQNFREHGIAHSTEVAYYARTLAQNMDGVDVDEVIYAALIHDLGMEGGLATLKDSQLTDIFNANPGKATDVVKYFDPKADKDIVTSMVIDGKKYTSGDIIRIEELRELDIELPSKDFLDNMVRANHPLNSALKVLTDDVLPEGTDKEITALLAMTHSKSTSGISFMSSKEQWTSAVDKLDNALKQYNIENGTDYVLDSSRLKNLIEDDTVFDRLQKEALAIRDGDAMAPVVKRNGGTYMQEQTVSKVTTTEGRGTDYNNPILDIKEEKQLLDDRIYDLDGNYIRTVGDTKSNRYSAMVHAGENNTKFTSSHIDGNYKAEVNLVDANMTPNSTFAAIEERIGEVNTYTNAASRNFEIVLPKEAQGTALGNFYEDTASKVINGLKTKFDASAAKFDLDEATKQRQYDFYNNGIKIVYK